MDFWSILEQLEKEADSRSGGIIGRVTVTAGYKMFVKDVPQAETYFPVTDYSEEAKARVKKAAFAYAKQHGARVQFGIMIHAHKDDCWVRGEPATWKDDLFWFVTNYTDAYQTIIVPNLKEHGLELPWDGWARIGIKPDPYYEAKGEEGKIDKDQDGNPRFPVIRYIAEVYPTKDDALKAVEAQRDGSNGDGGLPVVPAGYGQEDWQLLVETDIKDMLRQKVSGGMSSTAAIAVVAKDFGVDKAYIEAVYEEMS